jgi:hypothetical protein
MLFSFLWHIYFFFFGAGFLASGFAQGGIHFLPAGFLAAMISLALKA